MPAGSLLRGGRAPLGVWILAHALQGSASPQEFLQAQGTATSAIPYPLPSSQTKGRAITAAPESQPLEVSLLWLR